VDKIVLSSSMSMNKYNGKDYNLITSQLFQLVIVTQILKALTVCQHLK
jgi:hypothetical protein